MKPNEQSTVEAVAFTGAQLRHKAGGGCGGRAAPDTTLTLWNDREEVFTARLDTIVEAVNNYAALVEANNRVTNNHAELFKDNFKLSNAINLHIDIEAGLREENRKLKEIGREMLAYIEMKLAHTGAQSVPEIMEALKHVSQIAYTETAHHIGCSQTTRRVDLNKARAALNS